MTGPGLPRLELRTLGLVDLRGPAGADCGAVLRQPKRLALLAYLVVATPRRFHRRDSLLALLWPELDQDRARAALRRSLYFIRSALGADTIIGRGEDEVMVGEDAVWCDASAFAAALSAGDAAGALELYQGDLLDGLYVSGAGEYEQWLERERGRLRELASAAAWSRSDIAAAAGDSAEAGAMARRAAAIAPDDEEALRRLLIRLEEIGDRAGAHRAYEEHARRLAADELEPTAETRTLMEGIRAYPAPAARPPPAGIPISADRIAIFPFVIRGDPELAYLAEGMVDLLATELDGAGDVRTVDPRALLGYLSRARWADAEPSLAAGVARHFGAGVFVLGSVTGAAGRLQATATLYSESGAIRASARAGAESEAELFSLIDELARQVLASHGSGPGTRLSRLAALTTASLPALKAYLSGEAALRAGRYFDALESLQRAVGLDPSFALAYYRLAGAAAGSAMPELAREVSDAGHAHRERLSPPDRLLLDAQRAWLHGDVAAAEALYGTITGSHPDDVEAWFLLGDLLFHSGPMGGRTAAEARAPFERALELAPEDTSSLVHLARIAAIEGRRADVESLAERAIAASPAGDQSLSLRAWLAWLREDAGEQAAVLEGLQRARAVTIAVAFSDVALYAGNRAGAERLARAFISFARSAEMRALCHILLAHLALADGRAATAWAELDTAAALNEPHALAVRGLFAALPFVELDPGELEAVRAALLQWDAGAVPPSGFFVFAMHDGLYRHLRLYLSSLLAAKAGDLSAAEAHVAALAALPGPDAAVDLTAHLLRGARARLLRARGRPADALAELESGRSRTWFQLTVASPFFAEGFERFMRAELLQELGRGEEAARWYGSMAERSPYELIYRDVAAARVAALRAVPTA